MIVGFLLRLAFLLRLLHLRVRIEEYFPDIAACELILNLCLETAWQYLADVIERSERVETIGIEFQQFLNDCLCGWQMEIRLFQRQNDELKKLDSIHPQVLLVLHAFLPQLQVTFHYFHPGCLGKGELFTES